MSDPAPTLTVGINSYASVEEAGDLAASRLFASAWAAASDSARMQALVTSTALLDRLGWQGRPLAPTQPLAWPRVADGCPHGFPLTTETPPAIIAATIELALYLLSTGELPGGPAVQLRMLGDGMITNFAHVADELPKHVRRLIEPFLRSSSANVAEVRF